MRTIRERYHSDPQFHALVDTMTAHIVACNFTPSELREAAILASIIYEEHNVRKLMFVDDELEYHLRVIRKRVEECNGR